MNDIDLSNQKMTDEQHNNLTKDPPEAITQSWHHKLKSPKSRKSSKSKQKNSFTKPNSNDKKTRELNINSSPSKASPIKMTYRIMRSIVSALSYIDGHVESTTSHDGAGLSSLYSCDTSPRHWDLLDLRLKKKITAAILSNKKSLTIQDLDAFQDVQIISLAILQVLKEVECLIPISLEKTLFRVKHPSDMEEVLCSKDWDELRCMVFIALMHHLAKILLAQEQATTSNEGIPTKKKQKQIEAKERLEKISFTFSTILFHDKYNGDTQVGFLRQVKKCSREKKKRRVIQKILIHFMEDTDRIEQKTETVADKSEYQPPSVFNDELKKNHFCFRRKHITREMREWKQKQKASADSTNQDTLNNLLEPAHHRYMFDFEDETLTTSSDCERDYDCCFMESLNLYDQNKEDEIDLLLSKSRKRLDVANAVLEHYRGSHSIRV